ncbi:MAG: ABC transporter substrate-binding protein [Alphaproteobacteria bacterium]|nr:ABC transporter substrate-binding protein [Alphaproteobacteria bacterium]
MRRLLSAIALAAGLAQAAFAVTPIDPPSLAADVASGALPPAAQRVPEEPLVGGFETLGRTTGRSGGTLRILLPKDKDIRLLNVWGYARLAGYDENLQIQPDILKAIDVSDGRIFTLHLRKGHKWSDGAPFTSEDFRYYWDDIANNRELTPAGVPQELTVDGKPPKVTIVDETTVVYEWDAPNPRFLALLAQARDLFLYRPAHYLKRFHEKYGDPDDIAALVAKEKVKGWAALHNRRDSMYDNDNPEMPTLQPFVIEPGGGPAYRLRRNPYFHRVDPYGMQLPYADAISATIVEPGLIAAKTAAGDSDLQFRGLAFSDATALKAAEGQGGYRVLLWPVTKGSQVALYPNLTVTDPAWRELLRDRRFRQALSAAIDRDDINQTLFYGLATPGNNTALQQSPLYLPERVAREAVFDLGKANALLDEMGLTQRDGRGLRLRPDGRPIEIVVESSGESAEEAAVLELIAPTWRKAGIGLVVRPYERGVLRNRAYAGESVMTVWSGFENGVPTPAASPDELAPVLQPSLQWPRWGQYIQTKGVSGEPADMPEAQHLFDLYTRWNATQDDGERGRIWTEMLDLHATEQFTIGTVSGVLQPIVVSNAVRNVPKQGIFGWDPGAQFGIYRLDAVWLDR